MKGQDHQYQAAHLTMYRSDVKVPALKIWAQVKKRYKLNNKECGRHTCTWENSYYLIIHNISLILLSTCIIIHAFLKNLRSHLNN